MSATTLLKISDLSVRYDLGPAVTKNAIDSVSLEIPSAGYTLGLVGESGSGKTTLGMSILNLIQRPGKISKGRIDYKGENILQFDPKRLTSYRGKEVSMVYQSAMNSLNPLTSVLDHLVEVFREHGSISKSTATDKALELLTQVGIKPERARDYPHEFSGGMKQRAVIAMALALSPKLLIADEPTSALDVVVQKQILALLKKQVLERNLSLIFVTHEIALVPELTSNIAVMYSGEIVELGKTAEVLAEPLHPYSEMLLNSLLSLKSSKDILESYIKEKETVTPQPLDRNACKFSNRCKYAFDRCKRERPLLREVRRGRWVACHKY